MLKIPASAKKQFPSDFFNLYNCRSASKDSLIGKQKKICTPSFCFYPKKNTTSPACPQTQISAMTTNDQMPMLKNPAENSENIDDNNNANWLLRRKKNLALLHQLPKIIIRNNNSLHKELTIQNGEKAADKVLAINYMEKMHLVKSKNSIVMNIPQKDLLLNPLNRKFGAQAKQQTDNKKIDTLSVLKQCLNDVSSKISQVKVPKSPRNHRPENQLNKGGRHFVTKNDTKESDELPENDLTFGNDNRINYQTVLNE